MSARRDLMGQVFRMTGSTCVRRRLVRVLSAQLYNQIATMMVQVALVPLLLHSWGAERYGVWLLLSAIPTYLTLSDFGFTFIAKNEMVMQVAAGARDEARRTFQSIFALLCVAGPGLLVLTLVAIWTLDVSRLLSLGRLPAMEARIVLSLLLTNIVLYQGSLLISAGIRCENRAASESSWAATARVCEGAAIALVALAGGSLVLVATATLLNRLAFNVASYLWMRRHTPWLALGIAYADRAEIRRLLHPALGYMLMPVSQALLIQGPVLVLGALAGPLQVVVFSTSRTLARVGTAATNMLNNSVVTEYSARAGVGDGPGFARIFRLHLGVSVAAIALYSGTILLLDMPLMHVFTHGKVTIVEPFFAILVTAVAAEMLWTAMFTPISAINRHVAVTHWLLALSTAGLALCWALAHRAGLAGVAAALLAVHGAMIAVCMTVGRAGRVEAAGRVAPGPGPVELQLDAGPAGEAPAGQGVAYAA
jgi:O-antigen/teichoic acid export membrane protein